MILTSLLLSIVLALIFSSLLVYGFNRRVAGPMSGMFFLFLIIFLFTWGIGAWVTPVGPEYWGISWLGYLFIAVLIMLLLGVMLPPTKPRNRLIRKSELDEHVKENEAAQAFSITFGVFFWFMFVALAVLAIVKLID